jgi:hypothetical protein
MKRSVEKSRQFGSGTASPRQVVGKVPSPGVLHPSRAISPDSAFCFLPASLRIIAPSERITQPGLMTDHCPASSPQQTNPPIKQTVTNPDKAKQTSKKIAQTNFVNCMHFPAINPPIQESIHPTLPPRSVAVVTDLIALLKVITGFHALDRIKYFGRNAHKPVQIFSNHPRTTPSVGRRLRRRPSRPSAWAIPATNQKSILTFTQVYTLLLTFLKAPCLGTNKNQKSNCKKIDCRF